MDGLGAIEVNLSELEFTMRIDSEYYRPVYLELEKKLLKKPNSTMGENVSFLIGPFGSAFKVENYVKDSKHRYVRGKDVKPFFLMDNDNVYMPKEDYERLSRYALKENDILISVVGTLGNASIISKKHLPAIFSNKSTVIRTKDINPRYLLTYLNTNIGKKLLRRKNRGAVQTGLNLDDLRVFSLYTPSQQFQDYIANLVKDAEERLDLSKQYYRKAENSLLKELGFIQEEFSNSNVTVNSFASFANSGRLDAEYYQPKYIQLMNLLLSLNHLRLSDIVNIKKSIEPGSSVYQNRGVPFIRVSNITEIGLSEPDIHLPEDYSIQHADLMPKKNTILFTKDGTIGIAYKVEEDMEALTSSAILHLTIKEPNINPDYLTLVLNSQLVQMQAERDMGGSIINHWRIADIENILIPLLENEKQKLISEKAKVSFELLKESNKLLDIAKYGVEKALKTEEDIATKWIKKELNNLNLT